MMITVKLPQPELLGDRPGGDAAAAGPGRRPAGALQVPVPPATARRIQLSLSCHDNLKPVYIELRFQLAPKAPGRAARPRPLHAGAGRAAVRAGPGLARALQRALTAPPRAGSPALLAGAPLQVM